MSLILMIALLGHFLRCLAIKTFSKGIPVEIERQTLLAKYLSMTICIHEIQST